MYQITVEGDQATLILSGEVDLQTTADLKNEISELAGISSLDIIASSVSYIDFKRCCRFADDASALSGIKYRADHLDGQ